MAGKRPAQADIERECRALGRQMLETLPDGLGFTLLVFTHSDGEGAGGWLAYISSADRGDVVRTMREFLGRAENRTPPGEEVTTAADLVPYCEHQAHCEAGPGRAPCTCDLDRRLARVPA